jgi:acetyl-CoA C-acetyltransferase/acetyl-CoA acyltransferase
MPEPVIASAGASPIGRTDLRGRDLFSVAPDHETDWPVHVFEPR